MLIYKLGDAKNRQVSTLKTASRIGNIIRKILFQNTNGTSKVVRDAYEMAKEQLDGVLASINGGFTSQIAFARA